MGNPLAILPLDITPTDSIPTYDHGINVVSSESTLSKIAEFADSIGSTATGILNSIRYRTGPGGVTPVTAQPQAVAGSLGIGTILLLAFGVWFIFGRK